MRRRVLVFGAVLALVWAAIPAVASDTRPVPAAMASLGDSITRGFHSGCGLLIDCPENSWSTGTAVQSHFQRMDAIDPVIDNAHNLAVTGAKAADLASQASSIPPGVGYVTVLIGANDACTDTVDEMTSVTDFAEQVRAGFDAIEANSDAGTAVFVASIPDLYRLWEVGKGSFWARWAWSTYGICQSMLANPLSTRAADEQRRQTVRQRVVDYNTVLRSECEALTAVGCVFDGGAVFATPFERSHLSTIDYFHPNVSGQELLASVTWDAGFTWVAGGEPEPEPEPDPDPTGTIVAVGDLDAIASSSAKTWTASVSIQVVDAADGPVSNATVTGQWIGTTGETTCNTDGNGWCTVDSADNRKKSVQFTVTGISGADLVYDSTLNREPDSDSDGTTITIRRP